MAKWLVVFEYNYIYLHILVLGIHFCLIYKNNSDVCV